MFHWICPECGSEIPPTVRECAACDPHAAPQVQSNPPAPGPVEAVPAPAAVTAIALLEAPQALPPVVPPFSPPAGAPAEKTKETPIHPLLALADRIQAIGLELVPKPVPVSEAVLLAPPAPAPLEPPPLPAPADESLPELIPQMDEPNFGWMPIADELSLVTGTTPAELVTEAEQIPQKPEPEPALPQAEVASVPEEPAVATAPMAPEAPPSSEPVVELALEPSAPVVKEASPSVEQLALVLQATSLVALLAPPVRSSGVQPSGMPEPIPAPQAEPAISAQNSETAPMSTVRQLQPASVTPVLKFSEPAPAGTAAPLSNEPSGISNPPSGSWLALAPLQNYSRVARRAMQPAASATKILSSNSGPQVTLPGPMLPPQLASFQDAKLLPVGDEERSKRRRRNSLPGWMISAMVMIVLLVLGVGAVFSVLPTSSNADAKTTTPAAQATPVQASSHPLAQYIEVTGFRIVVDFNKKSEIHYLVVNHSPARLSDMMVYVTLKAADATPGEPPLCRFSFRAPDLVPFGSKEMISAIEKLDRSVVLPEWGNLRSEVQVTQ